MSLDDWMNIYSSVVEFLPEEVHIWKVIRDKDKKIKTWTLVNANPRALKSWNKQLSEIVGKSTDEIFPNAEPTKNFLPIVEKIFSEKRPYKWKSYFTGTNQILEMISIPVENYFISVGSDATSKIKAEAYINQAHRLESLGVLAGGVAHDLNTILAIILNCADRLEEINNDNHQLQLIRTISEACISGSDLTKLVLAHAKNDQISEEEIEINDVLNNVFRLFSISSGEHINIVVNENRKLPKIKGNRIQIRQILFNIANNAIQAMRESGGTLTFSLQQVLISKEQIPEAMGNATPGNFLKITVSDTGCGIETSYHSNIFEPFSSFDQKKGGSGLGLSIVKTLVQSHHGFVTFQSKLGEGSQFHIYFPI